MKIFLLIAIVIFICTGCGNDDNKIEKIPLVKVQHVKFISAQSTENFSGVVKGRYETDLAFQVGGKIISRNVQVGSTVRAGDILMTIDPKDIVEQNKTFAAQVSSAFAQMKLAESNLQRYSELFKEDAISAATLEQYKTEYAAATANYNSALAQAEQSNNALDYTNLFATADGVISAINAEVGQVISAGQTILKLTQTNEMEVEINIPENKISEIKIGQPCEINFWANDKIIAGRVREISPIADNNSRTFTVKISIENLSENIQLGMTANVLITEKNLNTQEIILPLSAIYQTGETPQVWIVKDDKVTLKNISTADFENNFVKVRGLSAGDIVVIAGVHKLREGQAVRLLEE